MASYKCGKCGKRGHNARTCKSKKKASTKKKITKRRSKKKVVKKRVVKKRATKKKTTKKATKKKTTRKKATKKKTTRKKATKKKTTRKKVARKKVARKKVAGSAKSWTIDEDEVPNKWPAKWNKVYEYALSLARKWSGYKPRGYGSRSPYRKPELSIDPYHEYIYVRFVDVGPGARGQSLWGHDIMEQKSFEGRMKSLDAAAIGKAVHEATGIKVDVDTTKRNGKGEWGFNDRRRIVFEAKPQRAAPRRTRGRATPLGERPRCASCGEICVKRVNRRTGGGFWGCSQYPDCRGRCPNNSYRRRNPWHWTRRRYL